MIKTKQITDIIEAVMERVEVVRTSYIEDAYPILPIKDRNDLMSIIKKIIEGNNIKQNMNLDDAKQDEFSHQIKYR